MRVPVPNGKYGLTRVLAAGVRWCGAQCVILNEQCLLVMGACRRGFSAFPALSALRTPRTLRTLAL